MASTGSQQVRYGQLGGLPLLFSPEVLEKQPSTVAAVVPARWPRSSDVVFSAAGPAVTPEPILPGGLLSDHCAERPDSQAAACHSPAASLFAEDTKGARYFDTSHRSYTSIESTINRTNINKCQPLSLSTVDTRPLHLLDLLGSRQHPSFEYPFGCPPVTAWFFCRGSGFPFLLFFFWPGDCSCIEFSSERA